jgi:hypothetical protein
VEFNIKSTTGKYYSECRNCKIYGNQVKNPKYNPKNNPKNNKKVCSLISPKNLNDMNPIKQQSYPRLFAVGGYLS